MNNEPVAWQGLTAEEIATIPNDEFRLQKVEKILKNRNTHPAKTPTLVLDGNRVYPTTKTLTDEEIKDVYFNTFNWNFSESASSPFLDFARAILKKASEK
jgi:hypothetical protein